jgi:hypothetical protein
LLQVNRRDSEESGNEEEASDVRISVDTLVIVQETEAKEDGEDEKSYGEKLNNYI